MFASMSNMSTLSSAWPWFVPSRRVCVRRVRQCPVLLPRQVRPRHPLAGILSDHPQQLAEEDPRDGAAGELGLLCTQG